MTRLEDYLQDGASYQARATLMYLQIHSDIQESWNSEYHTYDANIKVARWENCREQGYILSLRDANHEQLNIAFFEHRNSDEICAVKWLQNSINTITIDTAKFKNVYKDKWDVSHSVNFSEANNMADWIYEELKVHWIKSIKISTNGLQ